ncbi:MAG: bifunctional phosphoribosylaminoimidazolecarboxamide formyltransferase/IMP cyclohydrolase [Spirochaetaceae bacterium]|jgi:phosphoribosylaminoimidazolecarboxamide formyltransferase/IMP cyclohydrolase|nr:bifunctional phosphoribosylaminoimidazolecarboxamide formyltransferase/IMP cyclohydrolase [Spirochaetaceae bacterium]
MKKRALISVYDKSNVTELAAALTEMNWELVSTGGTAAYLREAGFAVTSVESLTGFPECLDGRIKTLHPAVHAGLLARRTEKSHRDALEKLDIGMIDLVAVNLYPFFQKLNQTPPLTQDELIEFIDIGGPAMLRSAAKNFNDVIALCDPEDYHTVIQSLRQNSGLDIEFKKRLAGKVFNLTSAYDASVSQFLLSSGKTEFPPYYNLSLKRAAPLRYGENPQQKAALYLRTDERGAMAKIEQLGGKALSYNNYRDIDLAWKAVCSFGMPDGGFAALGADDAARLLNFKDNATLKACVAVKHNTPCGAALGENVLEAFEKTYLCDTVSIFGGVVAFNSTLDAETAQKLNSIFLEVVIAPAYKEEAVEILQKKQNLCVILAAFPPSERQECVSIDGGLLVQETNKTLLEKWDVVTKTRVDPADIPDMLFGLRLVNSVKSNAVVLVKDGAAIGIGGGQTSRINSAEQALQKAGMRGNSATPRVLASDAFFPFPDVVEAAAKGGVKAIIQSGGSNKDALSIEACDKYGIAMVFTGARYFKH